MISEEKMNHILHLLFRGLKNEKMVEFVKEDEALREARKAASSYLKTLMEGPGTHSKTTKK